MNKELSKRILSSIILVPLAFFFIIKGTPLFYVFIFLCFLISSYEWHKMSKKKSYYIFGFIFMILTFYSSFKLYVYDNNYLYFLSVIIICISTDIGGYIFGKIFKGPKITKISPKKTYSGMIGGYALTLIFLNVFDSLFSLSISQFQSNLSFVVFILLVSTVSQLGDIIVSYFKRLSQIKDTGSIIPGHGGLLDRIDGMIFAIPFSYLILKINIF